MRVGYADPPYLGCAHLYKDHVDFDGEVDHWSLLRTLDANYDGWLLHTASTTLPFVLECAHDVDVDGFRIMAWVKPFAAFKRNVSVAHEWEPVLVKPCRKPVVTEAMVMRDWVSEPITMQHGLTGAKPETVYRWAFHVLGMEPEDELVDLFPGTGAVSQAWERWRNEPRLAFAAPDLPEGTP